MALTIPADVSSDDLDRCGPPTAITRSPYLKGLRIELRPVDRPPPERHTVSILYRRDGHTLVQVGAGYLKGGQWFNYKHKPLDHEGLHWTAMVDD